MDVQRFAGTSLTRTTRQANVAGSGQSLTGDRSGNDHVLAVAPGAREPPAENRTSRGNVPSADKSMATRCIQEIHAAKHKKVANRRVANRNVGTNGGLACVSAPPQSTDIQLQNLGTGLT